MRLASPAEQVETTDAEGEEQCAHQVAEPRTALYRRDDDERDPDAHEEQSEDHDQGAVRGQAAFRPATTITLEGACFRTKSTVSLKTPRPLAPRGAPMTMISLWRRAASSTIARPACRARTIRSVHFQPESSAIASAAYRASSSMHPAPSSRVH